MPLFHDKGFVSFKENQIFGPKLQSLIIDDSTDNCRPCSDFFTKKFLLVQRTSIKNSHTNKWILICPNLAHLPHYSCNPINLKSLNISLIYRIFSFVS